MKASATGVNQNGMTSSRHHKPWSMCFPVRYQSRDSPPKGCQAKEHQVAEGKLPRTTVLGSD